LSKVVDYYDFLTLIAVPPLVSKLNVGGLGVFAGFSGLTYSGFSVDPDTLLGLVASLRYHVVLFDFLDVIVRPVSDVRWDFHIPTGC